MKLSTRHDLEIPIAQVFAALADVERFEGQLRERGAEVERIEAATTPIAGMTWRVALDWHGRRRQIDTVLTRYAPPEAMVLHSKGAMLEAETEVQLVALALGTTRIIVGVDLRPRSLSGRMLLRSLRLGKTSLEARLARHVAGVAKDIDAPRRGRNSDSDDGG